MSESSKAPESPARNEKPARNGHSRPEVKRTPLRLLRPRRDWAYAAILAAVAFAVYVASLSSSLSPSSSYFSMSALGLAPMSSAQHIVWGLYAKLFAGSGDGMAFRMNFSSAVAGAVAIGMLYIVIANFLAMMMDGSALWFINSTEDQNRAERVTRRGIVLGALAGTIAMVFCVPFWTVSTQSHYHALYIAWLLASSYFFLRFFHKGGGTHLLLGTVLHAAGMTQTSAFVAFLPLMAAIVFAAMWRHQKFRPAYFLIIIAGGLVGTCLFFVNAVIFQHSDSFEIMGYGGFFQIIRMLGTYVARGVFGSLPKAGWMAIIGLSIAPWLATVIVSKRALDGERDWSFLVLHGVLIALVVAVLLGVKGSPSDLVGANGNASIVPYLLCCMAYGNIVAYFFFLPLFFLGGDTNDHRIGRAIKASSAIGAVALAFAASTFALNRDKVNSKDFSFLGKFADLVIDSLDGREWIVTNGFFDDAIILRSAERGMNVKCINISRNSTMLVIRHIRSKLATERLRNTCELGLIPLIQEWVSNNPSAKSDLAFMIFADMWMLSDYESLPNGLVFIGASQDEVKSLDFAAQEERYMKSLEAVRSLVDDEAREDGKTGGKASIIRAYKSIARSQTSLVGNNLGYLAEQQGKKDIAFDIYDKVHEFDPNNVSAMLNRAKMIIEGTDDAKKREVVAELDKLHKDIQSRKYPIWALARACGFISEPEWFARLGWTWAQTGQPNVALKALKSAENDISPERRNLLKANIARIHMMQNRPLEEERVYREMLKEDSGSQLALMGLVKLNMLRGTDEGLNAARKLLISAQQAGIPEDEIALNSAQISVLEGDAATALVVLHELTTKNPKHAMAWTTLCGVLMDQGNESALNLALEKMESIFGSGNIHVLLTKGTIAMTKNDLKFARSLYNQAQQQNPRSIPILMQLLRIDYMEGNMPSGEEHAKAILRLDLNNAMANYIMGSVAIANGKYSKAEDYLRHAVEIEPTFSALNDLAMAEYYLAKYDQALGHAEEAIRLNPSNYAVWDTKGMILMSQEKFQDAVVAFERSISLNTEDLSAHIHLACAYLAAGKPEMALQIIRSIDVNDDASFLRLNAKDKADYENLITTLK